MKITVKSKPINQVRMEAVASYNNRNAYQNLASEEDAPEFLDRITVNYIRHALTEYDLALWEAAGKTGIDLAITEIRKRVYSAIAVAYPSLSEECAKQMVERQWQMQYAKQTSK